MLVAWWRAPTAALLCAGGTVAAGAAVWRLIDQGNAELARFVAALERGDLSQSFARPRRGAGFDDLGAAYERAVARLRGERAATLGKVRFAEALVDGAPVALLLVEQDGRVHLTNKAARRLFGHETPCPAEALVRYGHDFADAVVRTAPGPARLAHLALGGLPQRVAIDVTLLEAPGSAPRRIVACKVIQAELDGAELAAQVDLVRVLTHEIMNSLTPVTSLAQLVAAAMADDGADLADARLAAAALARRAGELERFVGSYRQFSEAPVIAADAVDLVELLDEVARLFSASAAGAGATLALTVAPALTALRGDRGLLSQVLLNLLKNAGEAAAPTASITVTATPTEDGQVRLVVQDDGPGIPPSLVHDVFLPFFTTKTEGTGIGLSFARQVVLLHGGQIGAHPGPPGHVELLLPLAPRGLSKSR